MKDKIHPKYNSEAEVSCDCGAKFNVGSTLEKIHTEICYKCNPLYTGEKRIVDTAGRVEKFKARSQKTKTIKEDKKTKTTKKSKK
ncbi:MAG: 50S ribosomal protein L31 [Candidatus Paceibacterota bacterium]|jgi:large subunit ribosomal protein L31